MKKSKYLKAMKVHENKLNEYLNELHELVDEMLDDNVSVSDVMGILETEKMFRFNSAVEKAKTQSFIDMLGDMFDDLDEDEGEQGL